MWTVAGPRLLFVSLLTVLFLALPEVAPPLFAQSSVTGSRDAMVADLLEAMNMKAVAQEYARAIEVQMTANGKQDDPATERPRMQSGLKSCSMRSSAG